MRKKLRSLLLDDDHFNSDRVDENKSFICSEDFLPSFIRLLI